ncbi:MAG: ABC transporter ATP-binding protein [Verrucomicrobia bacterium]|nr:ABC transporter ATP-binding protein [Verrucomicrobiota bacterium]MBS0637835.1 ABC transporter ATP-binding protein [Verrucomicrobiota bacterium]
MKQLLKIALGKSHYVTLFAFSMIASLLFTFAGQLEMFSLGVIAKKGPDFFELFSPLENNHLTTTTSVSRDALIERFDAIDQSHTGVVTKQEAETFVSDHKKSGVINKGLAYISNVIPIENNVTYLILALIAVALFKAVTLFGYKFSTKLLAIKVSRDMRQSYFEHLQTLPMSFYQQHNIGSLSSRVVNDATMIADGINSTLINYFQTPFALITTLAICFAISWQLSLAVFLGFPALVLPIVFLARRIKRIAKQIQKKQEGFASVLVEFLAGIQTIKIFAMEDFSLKKYTDDNDQMAKLEVRSARYDIASRPILHTIGIFCLVAALLFGLYGLKLPLHEVLFYCGLLTTVYEPIKKFAEENGRIQRGIAASERMGEVLLLTPQLTDSDGAKELTGFTDSITFDHVSFGYGHHPVLRDVSFTIPKGKTVAIVGPTGAGKSTIAQLLVRLYDVQAGAIRIDGKDIRQFSQKSLRECVGFVPQRAFLFFDTVAENISFGRPFSIDQIKEAARLAHAAEFIERLPNGYNTLLAEAGKSLSGGQQQRIAIARAFIKNAPLLVMDEATSSLDAVSEEQIKLALQEVKGKTTQVIIAHRLSTIEDADHIIYIDKGQKMAEGTKEELFESCPPFKTMWELLRCS